MPTIAQQLCNEIVEPVLTPSGTKTTTFGSGLMSHNPSRNNGKTTRTVVVQKKKVINKLTPHKSDSSKTIVKKLKSKETFLKKILVDMSTNTLITGHLKCDNDCITMVRKRDNNCSCKMHYKKANVKHIQTISGTNRSLLDKACAQYIETISCGTQFLDRLSGVFKDPECGRAMVTAGRDVILPDPLRQAGAMNHGLHDKSFSGYRSSSLGYNYLTGKRWALSQYPTRGPDF